MRVLEKVVQIVILFLAGAMMLLTFEAVREVGITLLALGYRPS